MEQTNDFSDKELTFIFDDNELHTFGEWAGRFCDFYDKQLEMERIKTYHGKLDYIKCYYESCEKEILKTFEESNTTFFNAYPVDWSKLMTPIEYGAWVSIRSKGGIVLYPQYPVLNYHLDFANPGLKIGLELDGAEFHNKEKDLIRDNKLRELGWTIFRISGKEMNRTHFKTLDSLNNDDEDGNRQLIRHWILETGDGIIEAIKTIYFKSHNNTFYKTDLGFNYFYYCERTLQEHQSNFNQRYNG